MFVLVGSFAFSQGLIVSVICAIRQGLIAVVHRLAISQELIGNKLQVKDSFAISQGLILCKLSRLTNTLNVLINNCQ